MNTIQLFKRTMLLVAAIVSVCNASFAQAVLPTSYGFDTAVPTGWIQALGTNGALTYATGQSGLSGKLDATGEYVEVTFAEEPGALTYYMKGSIGGSVSTWGGTFTVEESADGSAFTPLHTFTDNGLNTSTFTMYTDAPQSSTRYIRFYFTNKTSGSNVALDEITLTTPVAGPAQEINVTMASVNIPNGFDAMIGNATSTDFTIENQGLSNVLVISGIALSGTDAAQFSLSNIPAAVAASSSQNFTLTFTPIGTGSRTCDITISSDDTSEPEYVIHVVAIAGDLASEPTTQPASVTFQNVHAWDFQTTIAAASPAADSYIVLRKKDGPVTELPVDGTTYVRGEWIGNAQVVYNGSAAQFDARNVLSGSTYYLSAFSYNGPSGFENYLTTSPTSANVLAPAPSIGAFYSSVDHTSPSFVSQLTTVMNPANYFQVYYSNYATTLVNNFYVKDTVMNGATMNAVECQYSGTPYIYNVNFQWWNGSDGGTLSREHHFPQSWMPTYFDANFDASPEVSDLHNLSPVLQIECNAVRSNYPYGNVVSPTDTYLECSFGDNANLQEVYEPRDSYKGNSARSVMYHAVKNNTTTNDFSLPEQIGLTIPYGQQEYVLKQWHFQDLPDAYEITRNEYIQFEQHNRNAFIDSVEYPCYVRFGNLTKFTPILTFTGTTVTCTDPAISYQWYLEGAPIDGATSATYDWTTEGNYSVAIRQFEQCPVQTSNQVMVINGIDENMKNVGFTIFPNPAKNNFSLNVNSNMSGNARITILDATGKMVHTNNVVIIPGTNNIAMDAQLAAGVYTVQLNTGINMINQKLIIE